MLFWVSTSSIIAGVQDSDVDDSDAVASGLSDDDAPDSGSEPHVMEEESSELDETGYATGVHSTDFG